MDVSAYVAKQVLRKLPIFDVLDSHTIGLIALKMKKISCNAGYKLFHANDAAREMYILRSGTSILQYSDDLLFERKKESIEREEHYLDRQDSHYQQQQQHQHGTHYDGSGGGIQTHDKFDNYTYSGETHHLSNNNDSNTTNNSSHDDKNNNNNSNNNNNNNNNESNNRRYSRAYSRSKDRLLKKKLHVEHKFAEHSRDWIEFTQELERGAVVGDLSLAYNTRKYTVQCLTWCEFYVIEIVDIWNVLAQEYPRTYEVSGGCSLFDISTVCIEYIFSIVMWFVFLFMILF